MKHILLYFIFLPAILANAVCAHAQPALYVSAGNNIFISAGTIWSADSLVLTPSADFSIQGVNAVTKTTSLAHPSSNSAIKRIFHFTNTTLPFSGSIAIYYADAELNGLPEATLTLNIHNGTSWNSFNSNVTRNALNNFVTTTNLSAVLLNELTLASLLAPLPVKFSSISTVCQTGAVLIKWETSAELNSKHFEVQRSTDGISWQVAGSIGAAGISSNTNSYEYLDNTPGGNSWYRIIESDADNRTTTSSVVKSSCLLSTGLSLFPNPVLETAYISIPSATTSPVTLNLYDAGGSLVKTMQQSLLPGT
ncbi:MAG: hypothetical protein ABJC98_16885, partial [Bacteroidota bacterium]